MPFVSVSTFLSYLDTLKISQRCLQDENPLHVVYLIIILIITINLFDYQSNDWITTNVNKYIS